MLEVEIQKLTKAVEALTIALLATKTVTVTETETPTISDNSRQLPTESDDQVRERLQAERDQKLADLYKAEQAKAKRKAAKVTPEETKALVEASTESNEDKSPINSPEPVKLAANIPEGRPDITETSLKDLALSIARKNSSARDDILEILAAHGAKTITQLSHTQHHAVHAALMDLQSKEIPF